ncbi:hypothetical protein Gogos_021484 [Gossypium gossypioides]|uniref:Uncharacterized protein n=1 Tax=Gossypium gossypioides TaxID=34282 RepID=A0A7J9D0I8_GOSGO|nr:hypothetical protein [Gossypium gossypioides]MBA0754044.1 hypothetical protein [Gossypium gossypioides]
MERFEDPGKPYVELVSTSLSKK